VPNEMTPALVRAEIETRLGISGVAVELCDRDFDSVLAEAVRQINRNVPPRAREALVVTTATKKYRIDNVVLPKKMIGVVNVEFVDPAYISQGIDPFDPWWTLGAGMSIGGDTIAEYEQKLVYMEQAREVMGSDASWQGSWEGAEYYLYVDIRRPLQCAYEYTWRITPDDDVDTGIQLLPDSLIDWLLDYATARAKEILARIRNKFVGVPMPDGSVSETDAGTILEEGRTDQKELLDMLKKRRRPLPPVFG
jgi:hypothetical protein